MDPLLVIKKCKPHANQKMLVKNPFPARSMIIFAEDAIYVVRMSRDLIESASGIVGAAFGDAGEMVGDFVGGKLGDWRSSRVQNAAYVKFAEDVENYIAEQKDAHKFDYSSLEKFVYRKNVRLVVGVGEYIGFEFDDKSFYFDIKDKNVIDPAVLIIEDLAPEAEIKKKSGPMLSRG